MERRVLLSTPQLVRKVALVPSLFYLWVLLLEHGDTHSCLNEVTRYVLFPQVEEHPLKLKRGRRQGRGTALLFQSLCFRSSESTFRVPFLSPKPPGRLHSFMLSALRESCTPSPRTVAWATLKAVAVMSQKMEKQVCWAL